MPAGALLHARLRMRQLQSISCVYVHVRVYTSNVPQTNIVIDDARA